MRLGNGKIRVQIGTSRQIITGDIVAYVPFGRGGISRLPRHEGGFHGSYRLIDATKGRQTNDRTSKERG